jgi:hypothetical protein
VAHAGRTIRVLRDATTKEQPMRVRRAIVVLIAALVIWTAVSFFMLATIGANVGGLTGVFVISHAPCKILRTVPPGGFAGGVTTETQAEMDADTAACNQPRPADFVTPVLGYLLIVGFGVAYATVGKRQVSVPR